MSNLKIQMKFTAIELIEKSMAYSPPSIPQDNIQYNFNYRIDIKLDQPQKIVVSICDITIVYANDPSIKFAYFKTICAFEFPEFDEIFKRVGDKFDIPVDIEILLKSTGLSTTRGIIFSELRGTYLHNAVMPLVDLITPIREEHKRKERSNVTKSD